MSEQALRYVRNVQCAPNGEKITAAERAILWFLAYDHVDGQVNLVQPTYELAAHLGRRPTKLPQIFAEMHRKKILKATAGPGKYDEIQVSYTCPEMESLEALKTRVKDEGQAG